MIVRLGAAMVVFHTSNLRLRTRTRISEGHVAYATFDPQSQGPWTLEATAAVTLFTDNEDFFGGNDRSRDPLYSLEGHVIYGASSEIWGSLDATYFAGCRERRLNDGR